MNEKNQTLKASFWYTVSNFFIKGLSFITVPIFSRILSQADMGYANNFASWLSMLTIITTLSLNASLVRARFDYKDDLYSFISSNLLLGSAFTLVCGILFVCNRNIITKIMALDILYIAIMFINMLLTPAYNMFQQVQRFLYKYKLVVAMTVGVSVVTTVLSLVLIYLMPEQQLLAKILGGQIPTILVAVVLYGYFLMKGHKIRWQYMKYSLAICCPYIVHLLSGTLLSTSDRAMITNICGPEATALYGMSANIALIVSVLWESLNTAFSPWLGEKLNAKEYKSIKQYTYGYIFVFCFILIGIVLITPEVLYILGGKNYMAAKYVIPPLMYGYVLIFVYSMYVNIEQFEKKTSGMAVATLIAALLNIVLNAILLPRYGYLVAAYTTVAGYAFLFIFHYFLVKKIGLAHVYDTKFNLGVLIFGIIVMFFALILYNYNLIRYILILIYGIVAFCLLYKNKQLILGLIK